jgi:osmotically inducible lipoprotein OsmB
MKKTFLYSSRVFAAGLGVVALVGCSGMNNTQQRTLSGAAIGTGIGAGAAAMTGGCVTCGAAIGAGAGAVGGYIYDQNQKNHGR